MRFSTLFAAAALMFAACRPTNAATPYAPYPETKPGTVYHFIAYEANKAGKLQKKGNATITVDNSVKVGAHEYIRISKKIGDKDLGEEYFRFDDAFWLLGNPNSEAALIRVFDAPPKIGAQIQSSSMMTKVINEEDPVIEGTNYKNLVAVEYYAAGTLRLRYVIDRDMGHVKSILYKADGTVFGELRREPKAEL
ncbi:MAG: hypothetical protein V4710_14375 [Verrucomicrobiota bacterium]